MTNATLQNNLVPPPSATAMTGRPTPQTSAIPTALTTTNVPPTQTATLELNQCPLDLTTQLRALSNNQSIGPAAATAHQLAATQAATLRRLSNNHSAAFNIDCITAQPRIALIHGTTTAALTAPHYRKQKWRIIIDHNNTTAQTRFAICWAYKHILDAHTAHKHNKNDDSDSNDVATHFADAVLAPKHIINQLIDSGITEPHTLAEIFQAPIETIRRQISCDRGEDQADQLTPNSENRP